MELLPHQQRVIAERDELGAKLEKLNAFLVGDTYKGLPEGERARLARQGYYMKEYHNILQDRIENF